jgi:hypothetical protein
MDLKDELHDSIMEMDLHLSKVLNYRKNCSDELQNIERFSHSKVAFLLPSVITRLP